MADTVAEFDTTQFRILDSVSAAGEIARPQICPADSDWIAYEIHQIETVYLIIQNIITGERRYVTPKSMAEDEDIVDSLGSSMNQDLSWRPVPSASGIWAAYISDSSGIHSLYLYELSSHRSYCLLCRTGDDEDQEFTIWGPPQWSPDGKCLVYTAAIEGDADIYIIRGMDKILISPEQVDPPLPQAPLITGEGNQFGAVWCPVESSGYLAYAEQQRGSAELRITVFDPLTSRKYGLSEVDTTISYFAPAWNDGGNRIAYYRHDIEDGEFSRFSGPTDNKFGIGVASVSAFEDTVILSPQRGGGAGGEDIVEVSPNFDRLLGPAWLPGGRHLVAITYGETRPTWLRVITLHDWQAGEKDYDYWLRGFVGDRFDFPRDLNVVNRNVAFTFEKAPGKYLLIGRMVPNIQLVLAPEYIEVGDNRRIWWGSYAEGQEVELGFLKKLGDFLWSPIVGPDIGINKGIVSVAGGIALLAILSGGEGDDNPSTRPRDWTPPEFPDASKARPGFRITVGF